MTTYLPLREVPLSLREWACVLITSHAFLTRGVRSVSTVANGNGTEMMRQIQRENYRSDYSIKNRVPFPREFHKLSLSSPVSLTYHPSFRQSQSRLNPPANLPPTFLLDIPVRCGVKGTLRHSDRRR